MKDVSMKNVRDSLMLLKALFVIKIKVMFIVGTVLIKYMKESVRIR